MYHGKTYEKNMYNANKMKRRDFKILTGSLSSSRRSMLLTKSFMKKKIKKNKKLTLMLNITLLLTNYLLSFSTICKHVRFNQLCFQLTGSDSLSTAFRNTALAINSRSKDKRLLKFDKTQF